MVVAHNVIAMNSNRQFNIVDNKKKKSMEKLSSGYKVNRAADDAAGLAISEKMRRQIKGLTRATENIHDGISLVQTADGALSEIDDILQRINVLAVQSANETNSDEDRAYLDEEVQHLKSEMNRIFTDTTFNDQRIWDEQLVPISSYMVDDYITTNYPSVVYNASSVTSKIYNSNSGAVPQSGIIMTANDDGLKASWTGFNGTKYESELIPWESNYKGSHSFKLSDYMDYTKYPDAEGIDCEYKYTVDKYTTKDQLIAAFNKSESNISTTVTNSVSTSKFYNDDSGEKIVNVSASIYYDAMLASDKDMDAYDTDFIEFKSMVNPALSSVSDDTSFSFKFTMPGIGDVTGTFSSGTYRGNYSSDINNRVGENIWWTEYKNSHGERLKSSKSYNHTGSLNGILKSINNTDGHSLWTDNETGGTLSLSFSLNSDSPFTKKDGTMGSSVGTITMSFSVNKSKASSMSDLETYITDALANFTGFDIYDNDSSNKGTVKIYRNSNTKSSVLSSNTIKKSHLEHDYIKTNIRDIYIQSGSEKGQGIHIMYDNMNTTLLGMDDLNVSTAADSGDAIDKVKEVMGKVNEQRSEFGAYQNRLEHSIKNNENVVENTTAAESQIRDTDMAKEMVEYANANILSQAGISILAQANQSNQNVLSLLQ